MLFILDPSPSPTSSAKLSSTLFADPTGETHTTLFSFFWPRRVAYQNVRFLHSLFVLGSFALSNVAPVLFPAATPEIQEKWIINEAQQILMHANAISQEANAQIQTLFHAAHGPRPSSPGHESTFPFLGELPNNGKPADEVVNLLATELENLILETQMRADGGPLKSAVDNAVERRKREIDRGDRERERARMERERERERERYERERAERESARAWPGGVFGGTPGAEAAWMQRHGIPVSNVSVEKVFALGVNGSPVRRPSYIRGRSRSLG